MNLRALAISVLLAFALYFTYGQFVLPWITVLPIVLALAVCTLPTPRFFSRYENLIFLFVILFFFGTTAISLLPPGEFLRSMIVDVATTDYLPWMRALFATAGVLTLALFFLPKSKVRARTKLAVFAFILVCVTTALTLAIPTSPRAQIDVWTVQEEGAQALVDFRNPYSIEYTNIYPENLRPVLTPGGVSYSYLPGTFMWMAPWKAVGLDIRYSQVLTRVLTALLLLLIAWRVCGVLSFLTFAPALVFLSFPLNTFFLVRAWNDDISVMFYSLAAWGFVTRRRWAVFLACNYLLILKQHAFFLVPLLIWLAWRMFGEKLWKTVLKAVTGAALVLGAYTIADWRNFLGSLYGLTFLKYSGVHTVFPDRRDPFSLMNYLNLFVGYKNSWLFLLLIAALALYVMKQLWNRATPAPVFRALAAMALIMFSFSPIAFANYYGFAWALVMIAFATSINEPCPVASEAAWEVKTDWWLIGYVASRATILFCFANLIIETRVFEGIASRFSHGEWPYLDFGMSASPFSLIPALGPRLLQNAGASTEFIGYHTLFQLVVLIFDMLIARMAFRRFRLEKTNAFAMAIFVFAPLLVASLYLTSATLVSAFFAILIVGLFAKTRSFAKMSRKFEVNPRAVIFGSLGLAVVVLLGLWVLSTYASIELNLDPFVSPTCLLISFIAIAPFVLRTSSQISRSAESFLNLAAASFAAALVLTFVLLLNLEDLYGQKPVFTQMAMARNILIVVALVFFILERLQVSAHAE